jgi:hypothetical protein
MKLNKWFVISIIAILIITAWVELGMGRLLFGPDGKFGLWEGDIWSSEQSQRFADPYTLTHFIHGLAFYLLLWLVARKIPARYRFLMTIILEAGWEILENSPFIINRYREVTISLGYVGDSVLNSLSDIFICGLGFLFAWRVKFWVSIMTIIGIELLLLFWVRDNLTLNIIMLIHPLDSIKAWQSFGHLP